MVSNDFKRGGTLLIEQPLEKIILNELNAGRCNEKAAALENDTQWRKPV
jgi:hypothetical protein